VQQIQKEKKKVKRGLLGRGQEDKVPVTEQWRRKGGLVREVKGVGEGGPVVLRFARKKRPQKRSREGSSRLSVLKKYGRLR